MSPDAWRALAEAARFPMPDGLLPVVVMDHREAVPLMLGYWNREALEATARTGLVVFWSRSRNRLWTKGESSGHTLHCVHAELDCDADAFLVRARPAGPTCHTGRRSCWPSAEGDALARLERTVDRRLRSDDGEASYTRRLADAGMARVAQKVGEEGVETALAAVTADDAALVGEAADLLYHLTVLLRLRGLGLDAVRAEIERRAGD